ncbi:MAG: hypothetical protein ACR2PL_14415, partial [Dehalococcoidia bacterium]
MSIVRPIPDTRHRRPDLQRQPRLTTTTGTGEGYEAVRDKQPLDLGKLPLPPDEAAELQRQIGRSGPVAVIGTRRAVLFEPEDLL